METAADIMNDDRINKKDNKNFETSPLTSRSIQYDGWDSTEWFETDIHGDDVKREVHGSRVESRTTEMDS